MSIADKLQTIAENEQRVFDAGHADGAQREWSQVWDGIQEKGNKIYYGNTFSGSGWTDKNFKPKYDIRPKGGGAADGASSMFYGCAITDLAAIMEQQGVIIDLSQEGVIDNAFMYSDLTHIPALTLNPSTKSSSVFYYNNNLHTIDKLTVSKGITYSSWFARCPALQNITFEGEIGKSINFSACPLTVESMKSVITHLVNYAETQEVDTYTVSFSDACWEALEAEGTGAGYTWKSYVQDGLGWLI